MISKIEVDERVISLNLAPEGTPNIFDVDSISLIIGNNGSGKTSIFRKIIRKFLPSSRRDPYCCDIYLDNGKSLSFAEMRSKWGVIYYAPIQSGRRPHATRNFVDISPKWGESLSAFDLRPHADILAEFNISPKIYAVSRINVREVCKSLVDILLVRPYPNKEDIPTSFMDIFPELFNLLDEGRPIKSLMTLESITSIESMEAQEQHQLEQERSKKKIIDDSAGKLYRRLASQATTEHKLFALLAVINHLIKNIQKNEKVIRFIIFDAMGLRDRWFLGDQPPRTAECLGDIESLEFFMKQRSAEIKLGSLAYSEIALEPFEDSSILKPSNLDRFFDVGFQNMSSGQFAVIAQLALISETVASYSKKGLKKILLLIDEGDAFLHLEWQRKYIEQLNRMLSSLKKREGIVSLQLIIATHSPLLATDIPKHFVCRMECLGESDAPSAFAAPLHTLLTHSFGAKTIGEFASAKIKSAVESIKSGHVSEIDRFVIESIDNPIIKAEVLNITNRHGGGN
ncbi:AAA family ATPase [Pseudomonas sp. Sample_23]|uniref:AAA family ATPase n=1 Tax=Pseudomonas sp. Sample_23 TaxID=2448267 RepID=UPI0010329A12|nr:AAA family ATPase [Pseudomonas sp. Sample_23]